MVPRNSKKRLNVLSFMYTIGPTWYKLWFPVLHTKNTTHKTHTHKTQHTTQRRENAYGGFSMLHLVAAEGAKNERHIQKVVEAAALRVTLLASHVISERS